MLVSYQVLGENSDKACISMFEFNIKKFKINPVNFVIVSQKISSKYQSFSSTTSPNMGEGRNDHPEKMLSVVYEDNLDAEAGSCSF